MYFLDLLFLYSIYVLRFIGSPFLILRVIGFRIKISYSQFEEDLFLKSYFKNKKIGFFIDIGCHHPFKGNNTYLLYKSGWTGINIDLNQLSIDLFNIARPRDKNIGFPIKISYSQCIKNI